jgi:hypothetical protein
VPALLAVACVPGVSGWALIDPTTGQVVSLPGKGESLTDRPNTYGGCDRYPFTGLVSPATAALYTLSPNFESWADWQDPNAGSAEIATGGYAGYEPALSSAGSVWTNASGVSPSDFSQQVPGDAQATFDPATGDLWWERNGHMMSNTVPPGSPVDQGPGSIYGFTPTGSPMPVPFFDSPSGNVRVILGGALYDSYSADEVHGETMNWGPPSSLTSACLEQSGVDASGDNWNSSLCGSTGSATDGDPLGKVCLGEQEPALAGLVNDTTAVCFNGQSDYRLYTVVLSASGSQPASLIPATSQEITDALVTPDGKSVLFFATGASTGLSLYSAATDGSDAQSGPRLLGNFGSTSTAGTFIGWLVGGTQLVI